MATSNQLVEEAIIKLIATGRLKPGERITHRGIAAQLGTSTIPVVQVLRKLEGMGLLRQQPDGSDRVLLCGDEDIRSMFALREILEGVAARLCAERATDEDLAVLRVRHDKIETHLRPDAERYEAERAFHRGLVEFAHMPLLLHFYDNVALIQRTFYPDSFGVRSRSAREMAEIHRPLIEAILCRAAGEAEQQARVHVREACAIILSKLAGKRKSAARE